MLVFRMMMEIMLKMIMIFQNGDDFQNYDYFEKCDFEDGQQDIIFKVFFVHTPQLPKLNFYVIPN